MKKIIIIMGGQGSGKGTVAKIICNANEFNYIETGEMLRSLPSDSEIAKLIADGRLAPDSELFKLVGEKITNSNTLLDGFPRNLAQAEWLARNYADRFKITVVYLNVTEEVMMTRIKKRLATGGARLDDADAAAVRRRLDTFWNVTMPAIDWFRTCPDVKFCDINASPELDEYIPKILEIV